MLKPFQHFSSDVSERRRLLLALLAVLLCSLPIFFFLLGGWGFFDPDEGRYGTIPLEMLLRGDFVTPTQNNTPFFDKPPLLYWSIALAYAVFGYHEWTARLVPALGALAGVLGAFVLGRRMFGLRAGVLAALILCSSLLWSVLSRVVLTDMLVSSLIFLSLVLWWLGHTEQDASRRNQTGFFLGFWVLLALAVLAKGPIAVVLVGGTIMAYALLCRQWSTVTQMRWSLGVPLFFAITAPWFVLVAQRNPSFNHYFWYDQHIGRFLGRTTGNDHPESPTFYLKFFPLVFFPWSFFLPAASLAAWRFFMRRGTAWKEWGNTERALIFLICGASFITLFFSISSCKILTYILPTLPFFALLLATYFEWLYARGIVWSRALFITTGSLMVALAVSGALVVMQAQPALAIVGVSSSTALVISTVLCLWAVALGVLSWRYRLTGLITAMTGGYVLALVVAILVVAEVAPRYTTKPLFTYIQPGLTPSAEVMCLGYTRSAGFYTHRRVEIIGTPDELAVGVRQLPSHEKQMWFFNEHQGLVDLRREILSTTPVYLIIKEPQHDKSRKLMQRLGSNFPAIIGNEQFLIVGNHAAVLLTPPTPEYSNWQERQSRRADSPSHS